MLIRCQAEVGASGVLKRSRTQRDFARTGGRSKTLRHVKRIEFKTSLLTQILTFCHALSEPHIVALYESVHFDINPFTAL